MYGNQNPLFLTYSDTFTLDPGAGLTGFMDAGANASTLIGPNSSALTTWTMLPVLKGSGSIVNTTSLSTTINFYGIDNLTGGNGNNLFEVNSGFVLGILRGGTAPER